MCEKRLFYVDTQNLYRLNIEVTVAEGGFINESTRRAPDGEVKVKSIHCNGVKLLNKQSKQKKLELKRVQVKIPRESSRK